MLSAKVVLAMYGDYQDPRSADAYKLIKVIKRELNFSLGEDYLCFIFRHFRIDSSSCSTGSPSCQSRCCPWTVLVNADTLFAYQQRLENGYLVEYANDLGLDIPQFLKELDKQVHVDRTREDIEGGIQSGVTTTPALSINENWYVGTGT